VKPKALILHATGTNRDLDVAEALELAGAQPEIVHINQLRQAERHWTDYQLLALPGGFSYADALGAGRLFALDLRTYFQDEVSAFVQTGKPVIGICNGFQALVKAGILPGSPAEAPSARPIRATLTFNAQGHFECRWVTLLPQSQRCIWTRRLLEPLFCPVAHGEGRFVLEDEAQLALLQQRDQVALVYARPDGAPAGQAYPYNPNRSLGGIAGVCNEQGNVLGLMPHPENHIHNHQHPRWSRGERNGCGLPLFVNGVEYAANTGV
jgi:phosphoribosylformylglycinamidine synthase subunit PurQ / glutaminase